MAKLLSLGRVQKRREMEARLKAGVCLHCKARPGDKCRGLCFKCWNDDGIRASHPPDAKYAAKLPAVKRPGVRMPAPTDARPGSAEKIAVLMGRVARGERLFHPRDAKMDSEK